MTRLGILNFLDDSQCFVKGFGFVMVPGDMCCTSSSKTSVIDFLLELTCASWQPGSQSFEGLNDGSICSAGTMFCLVRIFHIVVKIRY